MHIRLSAIKLFIVICFTMHPSLKAQDQPITKSKQNIIDIHRLLVGPIGGGSYNIQLGNYKGICDCSYEKGKGFGPVGGAVIEYELNNTWGIVAKISFNDFSMESTNRFQRKTLVGTPPEQISLEYERKISFELSYINIELSGKWMTGIYQSYVTVGLSNGFIGNNYLKDVERLISAEYFYSQAGTKEITFQEGHIDNIYTMKTRIAAVTSVGYDISFFDDFVISPEISYHYPLTPIVKEQSSWKVSSVQFSILVKYGL